MSEYEIGLYKIIGEMLREIRISENLTLDQIAEKIGVIPKTIQRYETGERKIKINTLIELSNILVFDYYEFMEEAKLRLVTSYTPNISKVKTFKRINAYKTRLEELYNNLNNDNKEKIIKIASSLYEVQKMEEPILEAAHAIHGASEEDIKHDDKIMDDENF